MRRIDPIRFACLLACLLGTNAICAQQVLTAVRTVRSLPTEAAALDQPVRLRGIVTALSGWKNSFFLRDAHFGISVDRLDALPVLHAGQRVVVRGVTGAGSFAPIVQATSVTVEGEAALPRAPSRTADDLLGGEQDSQWITINGTVRSEEITPIWGHDVLTMNVDIGSGVLIAVRVHDFDPIHPPHLIDASVRIAGVCGTIFNDRRQLVGARLFTPSFASITVLRPAPKNPFNLPLHSLNSLLQFGQTSGSRLLTHVSGTVTWRKPGSAFYLQSGDQGLFVEWKSGDAPTVGTRAEAVGYPAVGHGSTRLQAAFVRSVGDGTPVRARTVKAEQIIGTRDGFTVTSSEGLLVQTDGRLIDAVRNAEKTTLLLEDGHTLFTVRLPSNDVATFSPGMILRVTGICAIDYDDYTNQPSTFFLHSRSLTDIVVLRPAPWWNAAHAIRVVEVLGFVIVFLLSGSLLSRQAALRSLATTDPLTGLANRRTLLRRIEHARHANKRTGQVLRLLFIDVDHFKKINDQYGHRRGDQALKQVAHLLREAFPDSHVIGRIGGDEFVVVLRQISRKECEYRLNNSLVRTNSASQDIPLSLSTGMLECGSAENADSVEDLLERADMLMYQQKRDSRESDRAIPALGAAPAFAK